MNKLKVRFMIIVCNFIREWYIHRGFSSKLGKVDKLIEDLEIEIEKE